MNLNDKNMYIYFRALNPNPAGGGGGVESTPLDISRDNFANFFPPRTALLLLFFSSLVQLLTLFS